MKFRIIYDSPGRLRLRCGSGVFSKKCESSLEETIMNVGGVTSVKASSVNGGLLIYYKGDIREKLLAAAEAVRADALEERPLTELRELDMRFKRRIFMIAAKRMVMKLFMPSFMALPVTVMRAMPYIRKGLRALWNGRLTVDVLDAVSITAAIAGGSYSTVSSVMTLLKISALLEEYTKKRTKNTLSKSLSLNIDKVWRIKDGEPETVPLSEIRAGDVIRVQQGSMIPADGEVYGGEAGVNESAMTGEAMPQLKSKGMSVYAGTVIEEGSIDIEITELPDKSRIGKIVELFARIRRNYSFIALFNSGLLALGIAGVLAPAVSALMHNMSTMAVCASSMRPFLTERSGRSDT